MQDSCSHIHVARGTSIASREAPGEAIRVIVRVAFAFVLLAGCATAPKELPRIAIGSDGISLNGGSPGGAPSPAAIKAAMGEPSRIVEERGSEYWVYDELGIVVALDPRATSIELIAVSFGDLPGEGPHPAKQFEGSVKIGNVLVSKATPLGASGTAVSRAGGVYESRNAVGDWNFSLGPLYVNVGSPSAADEETPESAGQIESRPIKVLAIGFGFRDTPN